MVVLLLRILLLLLLLLLLLILLLPLLLLTLLLHILLLPQLLRLLLLLPLLLLLELLLLIVLLLLLMIHPLHLLTTLGHFLHWVRRRWSRVACSLSLRDLHNVGFSHVTYLSGGEYLCVQLHVIQIVRLIEENTSSSRIDPKGLGNRCRW